MTVRPDLEALKVLRGPAAEKLVAVPVTVMREAIWAIEWCIGEHYAPDCSREQAALDGLRKALRARATLSQGTSHD